MGNRITSVPGNLLKYAGKGISYSKSKVFKEEMNYDPNRLEGQELRDELQRVKDQSDEFKRVVEQKKETGDG